MAQDKGGRGVGRRAVAGPRAALAKLEQHTAVVVATQAEGVDGALGHGVVTSCQLASASGTSTSACQPNLLT